MKWCSGSKAGMVYYTIWRRRPAQPALSQTFPAHLLVQFLEVHDSEHLLGSMIEAGVGVDIQSDAHIGMSHNILERLHIHSGIGHIRAEGMTKHMRGYMGQGMLWISLFIGRLLRNERYSQYPCHSGSSVFANQKKPGISIHGSFDFDFSAVCKDILQALAYIVGHGNKPQSTLGFGFFTASSRAKLLFSQIGTSFISASRLSSLASLSRLSHVA